MKNNNTYLFLLLIIFYFGLNLFKLTALPVFADEAIYIRWAQLIIDDRQRYLFYPMNDGKTPLLMWLMVPFLQIFSDQLFAARLLSVMAGALTVIFIFLIVKQLINKKIAFWAMFLAIINPFIFFYNRLALTDGLLFLNLSMSYYFAILVVKNKKNWCILPLALAFFLAIMSKTPALLFIPVIYLTIFFQNKITFKNLVVKGFKISCSLLLAGLAFYSLRVVPLFSQLFAVGGNFLQDWSVIFSKDIFPVIVRNSQFFLEQLLIYVGPLILLLSLPWSRKHKRLQFLLLSSGITFILPLILLGKIVYPRYILPSSLFFIASAAVALASLKKHKLLQLLLLILITSHSLTFIKAAYFKVDQLALSQADREQFLESWSSGHGIKESVAYIQEQALQETVAVATEGYFGTLPDGILLNLHNQDVSNIYVEGIGQPVREIPEEFLLRAANFDRTLLIVNSNRLEMQLPESALLKSFCRPNNAPCLQVWELKNTTNFN